MTSSHRVRLTIGAERDLGDIYRWIADNHSPARAETFLDSMLARIESPETFPSRGSIPSELEAVGIADYRQLSLEPYRIIYGIFASDVVILLIADGRRDFRDLLERRLLAG